MMDFFAAIEDHLHSLIFRLTDVVHFTQLVIATQKEALPRGKRKLSLIIDVPLQAASELECGRKAKASGDCPVPLH